MDVVIRFAYILLVGRFRRPFWKTENEMGG